MIHNGAGMAYNVEVREIYTSEFKRRSIPCIDEVRLADWQEA